VSAVPPTVDRAAADRLPALARCHLRRPLRGSVRGEQPVPGVHGLGDAVVLGALGVHRPARRRAPLRDEVLLPARRRPRLRDLLDDRARMRADGRLLRHARHDRLRPLRVTASAGRSAAMIVGQNGGTLLAARGTPLSSAPAAADPRRFHDRGSAVAIFAANDPRAWTRPSVRHQAGYSTDCF
jgi:hypothetical protein